jgi:hypothetical protein
LCFLFTAGLFAGGLPADKATGVFLSVGVGPRLPIGVFANSTSFGYGFNMEFSYTDNEVLPVFLFGKIGFEQYSGSADFYQESDYTHFSTKMMPVNLGARYYLPPILEQFVLILPAVEFSASYALVQELNEFKAGSGKNNFIDTKGKFGFSIGAGISMFLLEIMGNYNFFNGTQTLSVDLKARLPLFVSF